MDYKSLERKEEIKSRIQKEKLVSGNDIVINAISYYEIKRGLISSPSPKKEKQFMRLCREFDIVLYDNLKVFDEASQIYSDLEKRGNKIGEADILIGALAKVKNAVLVTNNEKHFKRIKGLKTDNFTRSHSE